MAKGTLPPWLMKGKGKDAAPAKGGKPNPFGGKQAKPFGGKETKAEEKKEGKKMPAFKKGGSVKGKC